MEPITALAFACNVTQLVEQAIEAAVVCKEIYERGSLDENNKIGEYAESIALMNKELITALNAPTVTISSTRNARLQKVATEASQTAAELKTVLSQLKLAKNQGIRHLGGSFKTALKSIMKKGTIEKLRARLELQDTALRSGIVKELYMKAGEAELRRRDDFQKLSQGQKDIITQILNHQRLLSIDIHVSIEASLTKTMARLDVQDVNIQKESQAVVKDIRSSLMQVEGRLINRFDSQDALLEEHGQKREAQTKRAEEETLDGLRLRLLDALAFPEMNERRNMIEGHVSDFGKTYSWLFDPSQAEVQHEFVDWLETDSAIFWVSGKPGSGKSTLMNFIYRNLRIGGLGYDHLKKWAEPVRLLSFWFFRPASSILLKSQQGFWRSLCFQILNTDYTLLERIRENKDGAAPEGLRSCLVDLGSRAQTWTDLELRSWFMYLITISVFSYFLLIDGLDEVNDNREGLIDATQCLLHTSDTVKICCSSRPEALPKLSWYAPKLRLQDFNDQDIWEYCNQRLSLTRATRYAHRVTQRAEGVFLWAYLVAEDLRKAADIGDDERDLERRLEECPSGMHYLFKHLLERQDKFYTRHPKPYLRLIDVANRIRSVIGDPPNPLTLSELFVASSAQEEMLLDLPESMIDSFLAPLVSQMDVLKATVVARCANMVEFVPLRRSKGDETQENFGYKEFADADALGLQFIHRSAQDFLVDSEEGATLLGSYGMTEQDAVIRLMIAAMTRFLVLKDKYRVDEILRLGRLIDAGLWARVGTRAMDHIFANLQDRRPISMPRVSERYPASDTSTPSWGVMCGQLSTLENVLFGFATTFQMVAYTEAKLQRVDPKVMALAAGFCSILNQRHWRYRDDASGTFHNMLEPFLSLLSMMETVSIWYSIGDDAFTRTERWFSVACPLWQHMYLALVNRANGRAIMERTPDVLFFHQSFAESVKKEVLLAEGCIVRDWKSTGTSVRIFPISEAAAASLANIVEGDYLRLSVRTDETSEGRGYSLGFTQYSPRGLGRFLELEDVHKETLDQIFSEKRSLYEAYWSSQECLVSIVIHRSPSLSPEEIAKLVRYNRSGPHFIYTGGRLHGGSSDNYYDPRICDWEEELYNDEVSGGLGDDPVAHEIIKEWKLCGLWTSIRDSVEEKPGTRRRQHITVNELLAMRGSSPEPSISRFRTTEEWSSSSVDGDDLASDTD